MRSGKKASSFWFEPWMVNDGQKRYSCDPHACLKGQQQCKVCPDIPVSDGWKVGRKDVEPHRSLAPGIECSVCNFPN